MWVLVELIVMTIKLPFTYFVIYYLFSNFLVKKRYSSFFIYGLLLAIIGGFGMWILYYFFIMPNLFEITPKHFWNFKISYKILDLIYIASLPIILKLLQRQVRQEKQTLQLAGQKLSAELKLLKNQLHPHFLFNTLNNLYGMVLTNHPKSSDVVLRLSEMMSYMLYECERNSIALEKEIANLENYLAIEKIRYGKRLEISFETDGAIHGKIIAPLLLIPFVENAFKHGVENNENQSWIRMNLWVENNHLNFMIENSIAENKGEIEGFQKEQSGIGLSNVQKRLDLLYPNRHTLKTKHQDSFLVKLNLELYDEMSDS